VVVVAAYLHCHWLLANALIGCIVSTVTVIGCRMTPCCVVIGCQSVIDLKHNSLVIGDTTTPFLQESELPEYARLNSLPGDVVPMDEDRQLAEALQRSASDAPRPGTTARR